MKKLTVILLCISVIVSACITYVSAAEPSVTSVYEVYTWEDFTEAFNQWPTYSNQSFNVKLMADLHYNAKDTSREQTSMIEVHVQGSHYTFDFNGHTLSAADSVSDTDLDYKLTDFITVHMHAFRNEKGSTLRLIDSVGGGGISMYSHRAYDSQLAALRVAGCTDYYDCGVYQYTGNKCSTLIIEGGNYTLTAKTEKFGKGTRSKENYYRGCVIADYVNAEIYDGTFTAKSEGVVTQYDMCARELSAFATCCSSTLNPARRSKNNPVIYGGKFISDGYSLHHFDTSCTPDEIRYMETPMIYGGAFFGPISYIGKAFTYTDGNEEYEDMSASEILSGGTVAYYLDNGKLKEVKDTTLKDLHECDGLFAVSEETFDLKTTPSYYYDYTNVSTTHSDTFRVHYKTPDSMKGVLTVKPFISHCPIDKATQKTGEETRVYSTYHTINYAEHQGCLMIQAGIEVIIDDITIILKKTCRVEIINDRNHAEILMQPADCTVAPTETAATTIVANNVLRYQWQIQISSSWLDITDSVAASFASSGLIIEGYNDSILAITVDSDGLGSTNVRCIITSTAYSTVTSEVATITFGEKPIVDKYYGGSFKEGEDAVFYLWGYYFDDISWTVSSRLGVFKAYTLDEFAAKTGIEYKLSLQKFSNNLYKATVTFKNVPASVANKYKLGYAVENVLGKIAYSEDNALPFTIEVVKPTITSFVKSVSGYEGDDLKLSFSAENMTAADWLFEIVDDDGVAQVVSIEQMQKAFPDSTFSVKTTGTTSTLTITNSKEALNEYSLYAYAIGDNATVNAGSAKFRIKIEGEVVSVGDVNGDDSTDNIDAALILKYDAGIIDLSDTQYTAADVNGDGEANNLDAALILKYDAGIIPDFN